MTSWFAQPLSNTGQIHLIGFKRVISPQRFKGKGHTASFEGEGKEYKDCFILYTCTLYKMPLLLLCQDIQMADLLEKRKSLALPGKQAHLLPRNKI